MALVPTWSRIRRVWKEKVTTLEMWNSPDVFLVVHPQTIAVLFPSQSSHGPAMSSPQFVYYLIAFHGPYIAPRCMRYFVVTLERVIWKGSAPLEYWVPRSTSRAYFLSETIQVSLFVFQFRSRVQYVLKTITIREEGGSESLQCWILSRKQNCHFKGPVHCYSVSTWSVFGTLQCTCTENAPCWNWTTPKAHY